MVRVFAIDRIPSLADRAPYASYIVLEEGQSDGVPELLEDDESDTLPSAPKQSATVSWRKS